MFYQMHEGYLTLEGPWQDQSVNMLAPQHLTGKGVNLVVARDTMSVGMKFGDYLDRHKETFAEKLTGFKLITDIAAIIDRRPAHFLEFIWDNEGNPLHQMVCVIHDKERVVSLTASAAGGMDEVTREGLLRAIKSFRFGIMPAAPDSPV
jgi:hypothetical protein